MQEERVGESPTTDSVQLEIPQSSVPRTERRVGRVSRTRATLLRLCTLRFPSANLSRSFFAPLFAQCVRSDHHRLSGGGGGGGMRGLPCATD